MGKMNELFDYLLSPLRHLTLHPFLSNPIMNRNLYRARRKNGFQVARIVFLLLLTTSAWPCLKNSRNLGTILLPGPVSLMLHIYLILEIKSCLTVPARHMPRLAWLCHHWSQTFCLLTSIPCANHLKIDHHVVLEGFPKSTEKQIYD